MDLYEAVTFSPFPPFFYINLIMKLIAALLCMAVLAMQCHQSGWKQFENTDYNKDSLIHDCQHFYLFKRDSFIVVTFPAGEYDTTCIKKYIKGIVKVTYHKAWIDSSRYDLQELENYFSEFTHQRMR